MNAIITSIISLIIMMDVFAISTVNEVIDYETSNITKNIIIKHNITKVINCKNSWIQVDSINSSNLKLNSTESMIEAKISGPIFERNVYLHIFGIQIMPSIVTFDLKRFKDDNFRWAWHTSITIGSIKNASYPFFEMEYDNSQRWGFDNQTTMISRERIKPGDTWHIRLVIYSNYTYDVYVNNTLKIKYNTGLSTFYKPTTSEIIWKLPNQTRDSEIYHYAISNITQIFDTKLIQPILPYKKYISFTMDDGTLTEYNYSKLLHIYNFTATIGIITNKINKTNYMTYSQLLELYSWDFELADHTATHPHLTKLPLPQAKENISIAKDYITTHYTQVYTFIPPYGATNKTIDEYAWELNMMDNYNMHRIPLADLTSKGYYSNINSILKFLKNSTEGYMVLYNHGNSDISLLNFIRFLENASRYGWIIGTAKNLWRAQYALMNFKPTDINFTKYVYTFKANIDGYIKIYDYFEFLNSSEVVVKENGIPIKYIGIGEEIKFEVQKGKTYTIEPLTIPEFSLNSGTFLYSLWVILLLLLLNRNLKIKK